MTPPIFTLKARAEQMRRDGVPVHEVARAVGRSPSTIYGWAAQGGWRVEDLEAEIPVVPAPPGAACRLNGGAGAGARMERAQGCGVSGCHSCPSEPDSPKRDCASAACPACPDKARSEGPEGPEHQKEDTTPEPLSPLEAAKALHQRSADLAAAGHIRPAEAAARLADRILRTEYLLGRVGGAAAPETPEEDPEKVRAELADRFHRISRHYHQLKADGDPDPERCLPKAVYFMAERNNCSVEKFLAVFLHPPEM